MFHPPKGGIPLDGLKVRGEGRIPPAIGREDLREDGEDLRLLGQRLLEMGERLALAAQAYRDLFERLRISVKHTEAPALAATGPVPRNARRGTRRSPGSASPTKGHTPPAPREELAEVRRGLRLLLDQQGELGRQLGELGRHRLFLAGGEEPRKIMVQLNDLSNRFLAMRLSSESMVRGSEKAVLALLDDLSEINSKASEDLQRFGAGLRARGDGILSGRKEDRRFLQGNAWRRSWAF